jgi:hypothetical protein
MVYTCSAVNSLLGSFAWVDRRVGAVLVGWTTRDRTHRIGNSRLVDAARSLQRSPDWQRSGDRATCKNL